MNYSIKRNTNCFVYVLRPFYVSCVDDWSILVGGMRLTFAWLVDVMVLGFGCIILCCFWSMCNLCCLWRKISISFHRSTAHQFRVDVWWLLGEWKGGISILKEFIKIKLKSFKISKENRNFKQFRNWNNPKNSKNPNNSNNSKIQWIQTV